MQKTRKISTRRSLQCTQLAANHQNMSAHFRREEAAFVLPCQTWCGECVAICKNVLSSLHGTSATLGCNRAHSVRKREKAPLITNAKDQRTQTDGVGECGTQRLQHDVFAMSGVMITLQFKKTIINYSTILSHKSSLRSCMHGLRVRRVIRMRI